MQSTTVWINCIYFGINSVGLLVSNKIKIERCFNSILYLSKYVELKKITSLTKLFVKSFHVS